MKEMRVNDWKIYCRYSNFRVSSDLTWSLWEIWQGFSQIFIDFYPSWVYQVVSRPYNLYGSCSACKCKNSHRAVGSAKGIIDKKFPSLWDVYKKQCLSKKSQIKKVLCFSCSHPMRYQSIWFKNSYFPQIINLLNIQ